MKQVKYRLGVGVVLGALMIVGAVVGAKEPQFRDSITVQGMVGGSPGEHHLTFSGPVALPGVSLAAGRTYIFRKPAHNVLRVSNGEREPYALLMTTPITRTGRTDRYEIMLAPPLRDGSPRRLVAWFAPGDSIGQQLMYRGR
jgi:hypothetical protein